MSNAPVFSLDPASFAADPYPILARMRHEAPIAYVPELDATLLTRRDDIHREEKRIEVFSSRQHKKRKRKKKNGDSKRRKKKKD